MILNYFTFILLALALIFNSSEVDAQFNIEESIHDSTKIEIYFTNKLKLDDLISIRNMLVEQGIHLEYQKLQFDDLGNLEAIKINVDCNDGFSGTAETYDLTYKPTFGFRRNYQSEIYAFEIGQIN